MSHGLTANDLVSPAAQLALPPGLSPQANIPLRMIAADDSAVTRKVMQHMLSKQGFEVQMASDGLEAWDLLQAVDAPTIAILDWMMPEIEGVELCRRIRQLTHRHYTYSILLTSKAEKSAIIEGLQAGADDYVTKPFDGEEMQARLLVAKRIIRFQEELVAAHEAIKLQAKNDYLTRVLNRAGIMEVLNMEFNRSRRNGLTFSVIIGDVDHFKQINDSYGHLAGDDVLFEVASRIKGSLRSYDSVGRYGGEEFLIVVPGCDSSGALNVAERVRESLCQQSIQISDRGLQVTISLGVASWSPELSPEALLNAADTALYMAKHSGRNCTRLAS